MYMLKCFSCFDLLSYTPSPLWLMAPIVKAGEKKGPPSASVPKSTLQRQGLKAEWCEKIKEFLNSKRFRLHFISKVLFREREY